MIADPPIADSESLSTRVVRWIAANIIDGRWPAGDRLNEAHIAEELGLSRAPVREALRVLGEQGMVEHHPRIGSIVNEFTPKTVDDLYSLRAAIESWCAAQAVPHLTQEEIGRLRRLLETLEASLVRDDYFAFYAHAWRMREIIYRANGNLVAFDEIRRLRLRLHSLPNVLHSVPNHASWILAKHRELVAMIESGEAVEVGGLISEILETAGRLVSEAYAARRRSDLPANAQD